MHIREPKWRKQLHEDWQRRLEKMLILNKPLPKEELDA